MSILHKILQGIYNRYFHLDYLSELKKRGLVVGKNFRMHEGVTIDSSHCWHITIGDDVTLAPRVHIFAHDGSTMKHLNHTKIGKITIGNQVFIGSSSIILPGVRIGNKVIIGASSVVTHDIPDNMIAAGNPAKVIGSLEDFIARKRKEIEIYPVFDYNYTITKNVTDNMKAEMNEKMRDGYGYINRV